METSNFRELIYGMGLSEEEYDNLFSAIQAKYGISEEYIASQVPESLASIATSDIGKVVLPEPNTDVDITKYDEFLARELGVDEKTIAKITNYCEQLSDKIDELKDAPIIGGTVSQVVEDYNLDEYMGSQSKIGAKVLGMVQEYNNSCGIKNAVSQAEIEDSRFSFGEFFDQIKDSIHDGIEDRMRAQGLDDSDIERIKYEHLINNRKETEQFIDKVNDIADKYNSPFVDKVCEFVGDKSEERLESINNKISDLNPLALAEEEDSANLNTSSIKEEVNVKDADEEEFVMSLKCFNDNDN